MSERYGTGIVAMIWWLVDDSPRQISAKSTETYSMRAIRCAIASQGGKDTGWLGTSIDHLPAVAVAFRPIGQPLGRPGGPDRRAR